jgi:hypothetical protein
LGQPGKERMAELLDRIEEAKPQIFLADVLQQIKDQRLVGGANRPDENLPAVAEDEMPFPLRGIGPGFYFGQGGASHGRLY